MQIQFILLGIFGLILFFFGIRWTLESFKIRNIADISLNSLAEEIEIANAGLYSLNFVGGGFAQNKGNFKIWVSNDGRNLEISEHSMQYRSFYKGSLTTEYCSFQVDKPGNYKIKFDHINDLVVKQSMLMSKRIFQDPIPHDKIRVLIRQTIEPSKRLGAIVFTILGLQATLFGFALAF